MQDRWPYCDSLETHPKAKLEALTLWQFVVGRPLQVIKLTHSPHAFLRPDSIEPMDKRRG